MKEAILGFAKQFDFKPEMENSKKFPAKDRFIVCGMGGSHLAADILRTVRPALDILIHEDYGLPDLSAEKFAKCLIILSSYSGNTEEVLHSFGAALKNDFNMIAIATGGKLLEEARKFEIPFIRLPDTKIQPRSALGFSFLAMLLAIGQRDLLGEARGLANVLKPEVYEEQGAMLAKKTKGKIPVIYASNTNFSLAYNWKIKLNETGKVPAFCNVIPELNHNEMNGFSQPLSGDFYFIFLRDTDDSSRVIRRMDALGEIFKSQKMPVEVVDLEGKTRLERIFSNLLIADWFALHTAEQYGFEPEQVPLVEKFKRMIA